MLLMLAFSGIRSEAADPRRRKPSVSRYSVQALERGSGGIKLASVVDIADILGLRLQATNESE
jgi:hypothetical protein